MKHRTSEQSGLPPLGSRPMLAAASWSMDVELLQDTDRFAELARPLFEADPFSSNVLAVEVEGVASGARSLRDGTVWIAVRGSRGEVICAAMQTPPHNLFLPRLPERAASAIADALEDAGRDFPGVTGELRTVREFLDRWQALGGRRSQLTHAMRFYVLGTLAHPADVSGSPRRATDEDAALVTSWFDAFHDEAEPDTASEDLAPQVARRIGLGQIWLWEVSGEPVSFAGVSAPAAGVARVGPVYTPPAARRRGYGAAVTARATEAGLEAGARHVGLYTDLANPTSNAIYQEIGYSPDHDAEQWAFAPDAPAPAGD